MTKPKDRSPARATLADAIGARRIAELAAKAADDALRAHSERLAETRRSHVRAEDARDEALKFKDELLRMYGGSVRAALDHCAANNLSHPEARLRDAEAALAEAKRNRDLGEEGHLPLRSAEIAAKADLERAEKRVRKAIDALELTRLPELLDEAERVQEDYQRRSAVLARLTRHVPNIHCTNHGWAPTDPLHIRLRDFPRRFGIAESVALAPWDAARKALWNDPDAELPI